MSKENATLIDPIAVDKCRPSKWHVNPDAVDPVALRRLTASISQTQQIHPIIVREVEGGYEVLDGWVMTVALRNLGYPRVEAKIFRCDDTYAEIIFHASNLIRKHLTRAERVPMAKRLRELYGIRRGGDRRSAHAKDQKTRKDIADDLGVSVPTIGRIFAGKEPRPADKLVNAAQQLVVKITSAIKVAGTGMPDDVKPDVVALAIKAVTLANEFLAAVSKPPVTVAEVSRALQTPPLGYQNRTDDAAKVAIERYPNASIEVLTTAAVEWFCEPAEPKAKVAA